MKIEEIMTADPVCCTINETPVQAANLMEQFDVGIIPITEDTESYHLVGIVTDRDLVMNVVARGRDPRFVTLQECMSSDLICCHADDDVEDVMELMCKNQVRRIPVVDNKQCIEGMVSVADLVNSQDVNHLMEDISKEPDAPHE